MPTFSRSLEQSLHRALALANERHHEYATLEHLLLALIDDQDRAFWGRGGEDEDSFGFIDPTRRSIFGRSYAAEPD